MDILEILQTLTPAEIAGATNIFPDQDAININDLAQYIEDMSSGNWNWSRMSTEIRMGRTQDGSLILINGHHRFLAARYTNTLIPDWAIEYVELPDLSFSYTWNMVGWMDWE